MTGRPLSKAEQLGRPTRQEARRMGRQPVRPAIAEGTELELESEAAARASEVYSRGLETYGQRFLGAVTLTTEVLQAQALIPQGVPAGRAALAVVRIAELWCADNALQSYGAQSSAAIRERAGTRSTRAVERAELPAEGDVARYRVTRKGYEYLRRHPVA
jgi:hypothetical protein